MFEFIALAHRKMSLCLSEKCRPGFFRNGMHYSIITIYYLCARPVCMLINKEIVVSTCYIHKLIKSCFSQEERFTICEVAPYAHVWGFKKGKSHVLNGRYQTLKTDK